jgi:serine protease Do
MTGMTPSFLSRARLGAVAVVAFAGGLLFASGFNLTPFGYAQQQKTPAQPASQSGGSLAGTGADFVSIAERVTPAVVSIVTERNAPKQNLRNPHQNVPPGMEDFFKQFDQKGRPQPEEGSGSGFIVSADGYILTNNHVVADADKVTVTLLDKRVFKAKVVGRDPTTDVAVIKIEGNNFPSLSLGDDAKERVGEWVLAIGNPLGLDFTVTAGIISAKGRSRELRQLYASQYAIIDYIQTDAAINPGNSGGPLVNIKGDVIGINSAIASQTGFYSGYGFAIPITLARTVMADIIQYGRVRRAILGVSIQDLTPADAQAAGLKEIRGALVGGSTPGQESPAAKAGIEAGDVIVAIDGQPIDRVAQLQRVIRNHKPGDVVEVDVMRFGAKKSFKVKLIEAPSEQQIASAQAKDDAEGGAAAAPASYDKLGISVEALSVEKANRAEIPENQRGLAVMEVDAMGPAYRLVSPGRDVIVKVLSPKALTIRTVADLNTALGGVSDGDVISLLVYNLESKSTRVVNLRVGG